MKSSERAFDLIVTEEDGDKVYYIRHYQGFDWPQGVSGPTIAIGYDCGYVTRAEALADWTGIVSDATVSAIVSACGMRGEAAHAFVRAHGNLVTITWEQALKEFSDREMPKWEGHVDAALPNTDLLSGDSYGAIVSLAYNRGPSFDAPGPHYAEMRAIKQHMAAKEFELIPDEFLSMRRLWPQGGDLWRRREHEADLFRQGLGQPAQLPARPAPVARPHDRSTKSLQAALNAILQLEPPLDTDGVYGPATRADVEKLQVRAGLVPDGIAGNATWSAIEARRSVA